MQIGPTMLLTLGLLAGLTPFAIDLYLPAIPAIALDLGADVALAQLSVTVYLGVFAAAQLALGPLSDVLGRRSTIGGGLALFSLGALGCALAPSMGALLAARGIQALGGAAVAVTVPALVRDIYERDDYARVMSLVMLLMGLAPLVAPSIGGLVLLKAPWQGLFILLVAVALAASLLFWRLVPETLPMDRRHPPDLGRVLRNYSTLFRKRAGIGYLLTGALSFGGMLTFVVSAPYVYIELYGLPPAAFGPLFGLNVALAMIGTGVNARVVKRLGAERMLRLGLRVQLLAAIVLFALAVTGDPELWQVAATAALYISMAGLVPGNAMALFMTLFPRIAGTASALSGAARFGIGATVGSAASLLHDGTARPLLVAMGLCGLAAYLTHRALCCRDAPPGAQS